MLALNSENRRGAARSNCVACRKKPSSTPPCVTTRILPPGRDCTSSLTQAMERRHSSIMVSAPGTRYSGSRERNRSHSRGCSFRNSAREQPCIMPRCCSRRRSSVETTMPSFWAMISAVRTARARSLATRCWKLSLSSAPARASACLTPRSLSSMSSWPCSLPERFHAVSPCRTTTSSVAESLTGTLSPYSVGSALLRYSPGRLAAGFHGPDFRNDTTAETPCKARALERPGTETVC